jgi:hypothetical protein
LGGRPPDRQAIRRRLLQAPDALHKRGVWLEADAGLQMKSDEHLPLVAINCMATQGMIGQAFRACNPLEEKYC